MKKLFAVLTIVLFCVTPARASLIEANVLGGLVFSDSKSLNQALKAAGIKEIYLNGVLGVEGIVFIPTTGLGFGLRYDWQGIKVDAAGGGTASELELGATRYSVVAKYRFIDQVVYAGLVGVYGVAHTPKTNIKISNITYSYDSGKAQSASAAIEAGFKLGPMNVAVEGGFQSYLVTELKGSSGNANFDLNLGGFFALAKLGFGI